VLLGCWLAPTRPDVFNHRLTPGLTGTGIVLEQAKALGVKKAVYAASSTYYGNRVPPLQEDLLFRPSSPYGETIAGRPRGVCSR
jgi:nucleoside-diphosphate-sugar epimerase